MITQTSETLVDLLEQRVALHGQSIGYVALTATTDVEQTLRYQDLQRRARALAVQLRQRDLGGSRVLLLYAGGLEFLEALWACFCAGVIAVPVPVPAGRKRATGLIRIAQEAGADVVLTTASVIESRRSWFEGQQGVPTTWITTDDIDESHAAAWSRPELNAESIAYLQYTSGSTNVPKGVSITHRNAVSNIESIRAAFEADEGSVTVSWLPHFHDMGLVNGYLAPLGIGCGAYLLSPAAFAQSPIRWLRAMSRYGGTHSGGPNFAFQLCVTRTTPEDREGLDLSAWRCAYNGAEPVVAKTLEEFSRVFAPHGFRSDAHRPSYGLAEATLLVTAHAGGELETVQLDKHALQRARIHVRVAATETTRSFVSCGAPVSGTCVKIVDPETALERGPSAIGEIWVSSGSASSGYWNRDDESTRRFSATVSGDERRFLRTGDLGFIRNGSLYVTGRLDDLIIIRGCNHYPQDIEATLAQSHAAFQHGQGAVFSVATDGEQELVAVQEVSREHWRHSNFDELISSARSAVSNEHQLSLTTIALLRPASLPMTTSGKVQRARARELYIRSELSVLASDRMQPSDHSGKGAVATSAGAALSKEALESWLLGWLARRPELNAVALTADTDFAEAGFDSLHALELTGDLSTLLGVRVSERIFFECSTVEAFVERLATMTDGAPRSSRPVAAGSSGLWQAHDVEP